MIIDKIHPKNRGFAPIFILSIVYCASALAQSDTAIALPEVQILPTDFRINGFYNQKLDTSKGMVAEDLTHKLGQGAAGLTWRAYAPGGIAFASLRGTGPQHTLVTWNGLSLQNSMLGLTDISLLPLFVTDIALVAPGGHSTAWGSGAVGGTVGITPLWPFASQTWRVFASGHAGSFGNRGGASEIYFQKKAIKEGLRLRWVAAENDFPFKNTAKIGQPQVHQSNAAFKIGDVQWMQQFSMRRYGILETAVWAQDALREIPPLMTESAASARQYNRNWRMQVKHKIAFSPDLHLETQVGWVDETIRFRDLTVDDTSRSTTLLGAITAAGSTKFCQWKTGISLQQERARADGYDDPLRPYNRFRKAVFAAFFKKIKRFSLTMEGRGEISDSQLLPFTWTVGSQYAPQSGPAFFAKISKNYTVPTFNDVHWRALGNPALRPESGISTHFGIKNREKKSVQYSSALFWLRVNDWILWQPDSVGLFRPGNLWQVQSQGWENQLQWEGKTKRFQFNASATYTLCRTFQKKSFQSAAVAAGKQLVYTPLHQASASFGAKNKIFWTQYTHQFTGKRLTTSDGSQSLPAFHTGQWELGFYLNFIKKPTTISGSLENCWNMRYQMVAFRAMPGRNWVIHLKTTL